MAVPVHLGRYPTLASLEDAWAALAHAHGSTLTQAGSSTEGRPIPRLDVGDADGDPVLLTALMHGNELIGGLALYQVVKALLEDRGALLRTRLVVLPIVNPDGVFHTVSRLARGLVFGQRVNARGVDLNRNFPTVTNARPIHPFSGSRRKGATHYMGEHALSEPESTVVARVASSIVPRASMGFHSFGNLLLYPWAHTRAPHPHTARYRALGDAFSGAQPRARYRVGPAIGLYPTIGDLDDWLDHTFGTLATTVEVSRPSAALLHPRRLLNPFCWMNPSAVDETVANVVPGVLGFLRALPTAVVEGRTAERDLPRAATRPRFALVTRR